MTDVDQRFAASIEAQDNHPVALEALLEPCPMCNSPADLHDLGDANPLRRYQITCTHCGLATKPTFTATHARSLWNRGDRRSGFGAAVVEKVARAYDPVAWAFLDKVAGDPAYTVAAALTRAAQLARALRAYEVINARASTEDNGVATTDALARLRDLVILLHGEAAQLRRALATLQRPDIPPEHPNHQNMMAALHEEAAQLRTDLAGAEARGQAERDIVRLLMVVDWDNGTEHDDALVDSIREMVDAIRSKEEK